MGGKVKEEQFTSRARVPFWLRDRVASDGVACIAISRVMVVSPNHAEGRAGAICQLGSGAPTTHVATAEDVDGKTIFPKKEKMEKEETLW
ncbi:unnamed protein product [Heligmosomoides polygyrus]|uniref:Uncharacterized protein n=1 Tax=Heligmosomoides polygyrus TaxID=6339 RepID=A0A183GNK8_HELPZ|nr:unnamed protein product [Heligmosomoides polygyrus]